MKVLDFQERSCFTNPVFLCCWKNVTVKSTFKNLSLIYTVLFIQIPHYSFISEAMFTKTKQKTQPMGFKNTCKVIVCCLMQCTNIFIFLYSCSDYKSLGILKRQFPCAPLIGLTATATNHVLKDAQNILHIQKCITFTASFNRPNLYYEVCLSNCLTASQPYYLL